MATAPSVAKANVTGALLTPFRVFEVTGTTRAAPSSGALSAPELSRIVGSISVGTP